MPVPQTKRVAIRQDVWGHWYGYIDDRCAKTFRNQPDTVGTDVIYAKQWFASMTGLDSLAKEADVLIGRRRRVV